MTTIKQQLAIIRQKISDYEKKYSRIPGSIQLLAASKSRSIEEILEAYNAGQKIFGENYVQEALSKMSALPDKQIEWHYIGPIQRNKTRKIAEHFSWVHSVDSVIIAKRLNEQRPAHLAPLNICIEVNISDEPSKSGIDMRELPSLVDYCLTLPRLKLRGLMSIPALLTDFSAQRAQFQKLFLLWQTLRERGVALDTLSIGMSDDFEAAIAEGSTLIRLGTAIFGPRR